MTSINQIEASYYNDNDHIILHVDTDHEEGNNNQVVNDEGLVVVVDDVDDDRIDDITMNNVPHHDDDDDDDEEQDEGKLITCARAIYVAIENKTLEIIPDIIKTCRSHCSKQSIASFKNKFREVILFYACSIDNDDVDKLEYILHMLNSKWNMNVNTNDIIHLMRMCKNDTILHVACRKGNKQILQYIIEHFQIDNTTLTTVYNYIRETPFHMACDKLDILQYYLDTCHIDVDAKDRLGNTILYYAVENDHHDIVHYLRTVCHANEHALNKANEAALPYGYDYHMAAINGDINLLIQCIQSGIDVEALHRFGYSALHLACRYGNYNIVEYLISKCQVNVTIFNRIGSNAYHIACKYGHLDIVVYLLQQSNVFDVDVKTDFSGDTPLYIACQEQHIKIVQYLIENCHANVNAINRRGTTILHCVIEHANLELIEYFVNQCPIINVNGQDDRGCTPLYLACGRCIEIVQCLFKGIYTKNVNASVKIKSKDGYTPILLAMSFGKLSIVQYLMEECCDTVDLTAVTNKGFDIFDLAVKANKCNDFILFVIQTFSWEKKNNRIKAIRVPR